MITAFEIKLLILGEVLIAPFLPLTAFWLLRLAVSEVHSSDYRPFGDEGHQGCGTV